MKNIRITDMTLRECGAHPELSISFKEKLEIAKALDRLNVDSIELAPIGDSNTDALLTRTIASTVKNCRVSMPVGFTKESADLAWAAISKAQDPCLHVILPVSTVQMEYICHKKQPAMLSLVKELVSYCKSLCSCVDFTAEDATRSEKNFLYQVVNAAIESGATTVSINDTAGILLPDEFGDYIKELKEAVPALSEVSLAVCPTNEMKMSVACAVSALKQGADEIKGVVTGKKLPVISDIAHVFKVKGSDLGFTCSINTMESTRLTDKIEWIIWDKKEKASPFGDVATIEERPDLTVTANDSIEETKKAIIKLGYDLSSDDLAKVYEAVKEEAQKKEVSSKELDAIVANVALQVPPTYRLVSFVINSGNRIKATSNIILSKNGKEVSGLSSGDGPIDASFLAIEQIIGTHFELDDFQIQAVTEGREAMGTAVVKLRSNGKLYSGSGISTDIIASSINAYINALNKIVYEEG